MLKCKFRNFYQESYFQRRRISSTMYNGILKDEFYLDQTFDTIQQAKSATKMQSNYTIK